MALRELYADWRDLLARDDVDAVIVATPQRFRPEIVIAAAKRGQAHPGRETAGPDPSRCAGDDRRRARAMASPWPTVHNYHFMPVYRDIKEVLDSGEIGAPEIAVLNYLGVEDRPGAAAYIPRWRHSAADSGGGVLMDMLHIVYLANWFMGGSPTAVSAWVDKPPGCGEGDVEDIALVRYSYPNGSRVGQHGLGCGTWGVEIGGTRGRVVMTNTGLRHAPLRPRRTARRRQRIREPVLDAGGGGCLRHGRHRGRFPRCGGTEGGADSKRRSWATGSRRGARRVRRGRLGSRRSHCPSRLSTRSTRKVRLGSRTSICQMTSPVARRGLYGVTAQAMKKSEDRGKEVRPADC